MKTMDAREWKDFYTHERVDLGDAGLEALLDAAPDLTWPTGGAIVFPHTRLRTSGLLVAAAANAVVESHASDVLALGVLHGARRADAADVARARAGDEVARRTFRRVHGADIVGDGGHWREEFSLDNFGALVDVAARRAGRAAPRIVNRFPFLVGATPDDLPGLEDLRAALDRDALLVATTDPIHHGVGYGTPTADHRSLDDVATEAFARGAVEEGLELLARHAYEEFAAHAAAHRSDFRDVGPVLAALLPSRFSYAVRAMTLVDYSTTLNAAAPTWVAGPLTIVRP